MSDVDNIRARHAQRQAHRSSLLPTILGAAAAFAVGLAAVYGWSKLPDDWLSKLPELIGFAESGDRIGRPVTASLLRVCVTKDTVGGNSDPATLLENLENGTRAKRITAVIGASPQQAFVEIAVKWGSIAECIFKQNPVALCEIDNRALAVESANTFMRQGEEVLAKPDSYAATNADIKRLNETKHRLLGVLHDRLKAGIFIAADFRPFAAQSIRDLLSRTVAETDACAKKK